MNTASETIQQQHARPLALKSAAGSSTMEAFGALAAIALSIVGLAGVFSALMAAIATIILGAAILIEGGSFGVWERAFQTGTFEKREQSGGITADLVAGMTAVVLGILALLGIDAMTLISVALIVFGASFLLSSVSAPQANLTTAGGAVMVGLAAIVLGIIAVVGEVQLTLVLVGLLVLSVYALLSGTNLGARAWSASQH